jgi:HEAT repeat protein
MPLTLKQVRQVLLPEEPNYAAAARLGPELLPHLRTLISGADAMLASKAAYLAGLIDDDRAVEVLSDAASSPSPLVRVAAASGVRNLRRPAASRVLMALLSDRDIGVRKFAINSASTRSNAALLAKISDLSRRDPAPVIRSVASRVLSRVRGGQLA